MKKNPMVVNYIDWNVVLKCKSNRFDSEEDALKSIWVEEYANRIEDYNVNDMVHILGYAIEEVVPIQQRAYLLAKILNDNSLRTSEALLHELYLYLMNLQVRETEFFGRHYDLYVIERKGQYYTIDQYDELREGKNYGQRNTL